MLFSVEIDLGQSKMRYVFNRGFSMKRWMFAFIFLLFVAGCASGWESFKLYSDSYPLNTENILKIVNVNNDIFKKVIFVTCFLQTIL